MENASKALIMIAGVLIALMIIGALLLMFNGLSSYQMVGQQNTREAQVIEFNNQFETYNRKDVRGSDLYSLVNKVVDYNRRKSTEGTGANDEGQYLAYQPMTIKFTINPITELSADGGANRLIKSNNYEIGSTTNTFENVYKTIENLEANPDMGGKNALQNMATAKNKIFITSNDWKEKLKAINNFNSAYGKEKYLINVINEYNVTKTYSDMVTTYQEYVYQYYEYIQFKRAKFECTKVDYNQKTGRIIKMEFKFTEKFE